MTIGIQWTDQSRVPPDEARLLRASLSSYVRQGVAVSGLPARIGAFDIGPVLGGSRVRQLHLAPALGGHHVGYLVDNPNPSSGLPQDGPGTQLDYVDPPRDKVVRHVKEHPGFGWDPYGDD